MVFDGRETAPGGATENMYTGPNASSSDKGQMGHFHN